MKSFPTSPPSRRSAEESAIVLTRLFGWLERRFGGLPLDTGTAAAEVIVSQNRRILRPDLERLLSHDATALHVKGFFEHNAARALGKRLANEALAGRGRNWKISTSRGLESSDVVTLGEHVPFNVASASQDPADQDAYFDGVIRELDKRRHFLSSSSSDGSSLPQLWPLDLLRLQLDECWPCGAGLAREEGGQRRPFGGGLTRVMMGPTRWRKGFIHCDELGPLNSNQGLFSANVYLQLPDDDESGFGKPADSKDVLHIWPLGIRSRWDWYRNALVLSGLSSQDPEAQIRLRTMLGPPATIEVQPGDLVLLCVQRPHAAIGFQSGTRVSLQCFLQHHGPDKRLLIDS